MRRQDSQQGGRPGASWAVPEVVASCRPLFAQLQSRVPAGGALVLGLTSAGRGEGRTSTALGLAAAGAAALGGEGRVLLVDADVEHPTLHVRCGVAAGPGLPQVVRGLVPLAEAIVPLPGGPEGAPSGVWLLQAGQVLPNPVRQLKELEAAGLLVGLGQYFDAVIVDLPPVHTPHLGSLPGGLVPQLGIVTRNGATSRGELRAALAAFPPERVAAVILSEQREYVPRLLRRLLQ